MGKHERAQAKATEQAVVALLQGRDVPAEVREKAYIDMAHRLAKHIRGDFPGLQNPRHIGNSYDSIGDVAVTTASGDEVYIELKVVKQGTGTLSNISQNSLTIFDLVDGVESWKAFRKAQNHGDWVDSKLDQFSYPDDLKGNNGTVSRRRNKAGHLKETIGYESSKDTMDAVRRVENDPNATQDQQLAASITRSIIERDRKEKISYVQKLQQASQNPSNIKKFSLLLLLGVHKKKHLEQYWDIPLDELESAVENYRIYYGRRKTNSVEAKDPSSFLTDLVDRDFRIQFNDDQTSVRIVVSDSDEERLFLRASLHWGRKFQGIDNARLNVFEGPILKETSKKTT
ncbi:hypothetical protein J2751_002905 [Halorubrum alkaliphilum]|uniref:Restriction endonuclease n=1 Tax=Halorubrum alkaliphilum TaxID=261290 RepID=A0A8T4GJG9_9EURY|nr:hypothetical protein [Halorubrum alkaliphilum]MBP1923859.1 hypothetical protein [Halorubrum alkaliphilum]